MSSSDDDPLDALRPDARGLLEDLVQDGLDLGAVDVPGIEGGESLHSGRQVGEFVLESRLGAGGMGVVWSARQLSVAGRRVAIKFIRGPHSARRLRRFEKEIGVIARLDHPSIVRIYHSGECDGSPYFAMMRVDGIPASRLIDRLRAAPGPPRLAQEARGFVAAERTRARGASVARGDEQDEDERWSGSYVDWVARVGADLADALQHLHEKGVVHRDIKPANIMVRPSGRTILVDFGLARESSSASITSDGGMVGTEHYAAPEQLDGVPVDSRADVYSLGVTIFELLTLERPFLGASRRELREQMAARVPDLGRSYPHDLRIICLTAMAASAGLRYSTPGALSNDLRRFLAGEPIQARPPRLYERVRRLVARHPRWASALAAILLVLSGIVGNQIQGWRETTHAAEQARQAAAPKLNELRGKQAELVATTYEWGEAKTLDYLSTFSDGGVDWKEIDALEVKLLGLRAELPGLYRNAERLLGAALLLAPGYPTAEEDLRELLLEEYAQALRDYRDLLDPSYLKDIEARLRGLEDPRLDSLLETEGEFRLSIRPSAGRARVFSASGKLELDWASLGEEPRVFLLQEGSYVAEIESSGYAPARVPFLVRRPACYEEDAHARPARELEVELLPARALHDAFVYIPGGWTLVEDDPPRWAFVESFAIQRREVTRGEWAAWMNREQRDSPVVPSALQQVHVTHKRLSGPRWAVAVGAYESLLVAALGSRAPAISWPRVEAWVASYPHKAVVGVTRTEAKGFVAGSVGFRGSLPDDWYPSLPRAVEWIRAARGADARRYVWGDERTEGCDESVFGVMALARSVSEWMAETHGPVKGLFEVRGGTENSWTEEQVRVTVSTSSWNTPYADVGFRLVLRRLPPRFRIAGVEVTSWREDFRVDTLGELEEAGWTPLVGAFGDVRWNPDRRPRLELWEHRLRLEGQWGNESDRIFVWRCIGEPADFTVTAVGKVVGFRSQAPLRGIGLRVASSPLELATDFARLGIAADGTAYLSGVEGTEAREQVAAGDVTGGWFHFELRKRGDRMLGRVWPVGAAEPPPQVISLPRNRAPFRFVAIEIPNFVGATAEFEEVVFRLD
ncbi:MAG: bifunctional serine/threonine-protein kinase/formylglycine-generating enzyme family protein [Planctomycetota bacterium]